MIHCLMERFEIIIGADENHLRLDRLLAARIDQSRSQIQRWIEAGCVCINGVAVTPRGKYPAGSVVQVTPPEAVPYDVQAEAMELDVLFEDEDVIVLNKPAGLVVHPGAGRRSGTLVSGLLHHCQGQLSGIGGIERPGIVHRLDKDTSGVLVVAKNDFAHQQLTSAFQNRKVSKVYHAYVHRPPADDSGSWKYPLGRHPVHRKKQSVRESGGRPSHTDFRVLNRWEKFGELELNLLTGRTHQIRVHAAHSGSPLVGDLLYGGKRVESAGIDRHLLHAKTLKIAHPRTGDELAITAPLPDDFIRFESWLNRRN